MEILSEEQRILEAEERLRLAMLRSDINALDELLAPNLIFTSHLGQVITKHDDIEAHRSGLLHIQELTLSEQRVQILGDNVGVVCARAYIVGSFGGATSEAHFRFTRVWELSPLNTWQIIVGHSSVIV